jgi:hypothetical protein
VYFGIIVWAAHCSLGWTRWTQVGSALMRGIGVMVHWRVAVLRTSARSVDPRHPAYWALGSACPYGAAFAYTPLAFTWQSGALGIDGLRRLGDLGAQCVWGWTSRDLGGILGTLAALGARCVRGRLVRRCSCWTLCSSCFRWPSMRWLSSGLRQHRPSRVGSWR